MDLGVITRLSPPPKIQVSRIMLWFVNSFWILPLCMGAVISVVETQPTTTINWARSNNLFREGNSTGGAKMTISLGSNLVIKCPKEEEYYIIMWVTEREFQECEKYSDTRNNTIIKCNDPTKGYEANQEISGFNSIPFAMQFQEGNYFIATFSTGTKNGIGNLYHGACVQYGMRLNLTVTKEPVPTTHAPTHHTRPTGPTQPPTPRPTQPTTRKTTTTTTTPRPTPRPTTSRQTTRRPRPTNIPDPTEIIIKVPDNGNTATIVADSAPSLTHSWALVMACLCLSLLHILNNAHIPWTLR